ncbi:MAG: serine hydrolase domain-containing protein [Actinomycetota bacterium]
MAHGQYDFTAIDPVVAGFVEQQGLDGAGLIVAHRDDGVIYQEHWGEFDEDRVSFIASSSKMIAAGVLLALDDRGLLDIDAPIAEVVEWGGAQPAITPAQLVSNSSGLVGLIRDLVYPTHRCQFESAGTLQGCAESIFTSDLDDGAVVPADTEFRYGGGQWQVAGGVAEAVSGMTWEELIDEVYVEPCGLEALGFNNHFERTIGLLNPDGLDPLLLPATENPNIEGGAYVTTGDYGKLLLMLLRDGRCDDEQVLSPDAIEYMLADRVAAAYGGDADRPELGYGLGWWVDRSTGRRTDPGAYGSVAWLDADREYGAFFVIEANQAVSDSVMPDLYALIDEAVAAR